MAHKVDKLRELGRIEMLNEAAHECRHERHDVLASRGKEPAERRPSLCNNKKPTQRGKSRIMAAYSPLTEWT